MKLALAMILILLKNRVFESYAQLHRIIGTKSNPSFTDVIIPPGFEPDDFIFSEKKKIIFCISEEW